MSEVTFRVTAQITLEHQLTITVDQDRLILWREQNPTLPVEAFLEAVVAEDGESAHFPSLQTEMDYTGFELSSAKVVG